MLQHKWDDPPSAVASSQKMTHGQSQAAPKPMPKPKARRQQPRQEEKTDMVIPSPRHSMGLVYLPTFTPLTTQNAGTVKYFIH